MVMESKSSTRTLNRMAVVNNSNGDNLESETSDNDEAGGLRVGEHYQAKVPTGFLPKPAPEDYDEKAVKVWVPNDQLDNIELCDYLSIAVEKYNYTVEQGMSMLFWHQYDYNLALPDLSNFVPDSNVWTREECVLFDQALAFHDKNFFKLQQTFPEKSTSSLVQHYYCWKLRKENIIHYERKSSKKSNQIKEEDLNENGMGEDSDTEYENVNNHSNGTPNRLECSICHSSKTTNYNTKNGIICETCFQHGYKNGSLVATKDEPWSLQVLKYEIHEPTTRKIFSDPDVCKVINSFNLTTPTEMKNNIDNEIEVCIQTIHNLKQIAAEKKAKLQEIGELANFMPNPQKNIGRWSSEEIAIFMQAIGEYGKDFKVIADILGTKNENSVRLFFIQNYDKLNLGIIAEEQEENQFHYQRQQQHAAD